MPQSWLHALQAHAARSPRSVAIAELGADGLLAAPLSAHDLVARASARAASLARFLPEHSTILIALPSGIDLAIWILASVAAGLRLVLLHPHSAAGEFHRATLATSAAAVIRDGKITTPVPVTCDALERAWANDRTPGHPDLTLPGREPGAIILNSSGTTGLPRLAARTACALDADAAAVACGLELSSRDQVLCLPPLCHSYGIDLLLGSLASGAPLLLMPEFTPAAAAAALRNGVSILPAIPFIIEALTREEPSRSPPRLIVSAGSPLSTRVRSDFTARWGIEVGQLYGATELGTVAVNRPAPGFDPASIGAPLPRVSFRLRPLPESSAGEGELTVLAPSMLSSYIDGPPNLLDGHFLTGDLARIDPQGRATITGRLKLLIDVGGFKVNPIEVEQTLELHPGVSQCAILPMPLSDTVCRIRALIVPSDPLAPPNPRDLRAFLRERLSPVKIPRAFTIVGRLPRSPMGKLLRDQLPRIEL